jgi:hypothetical protein
MVDIKGENISLKKYVKKMIFNGLLLNYKMFLYFYNRPQQPFIFQ